MCPKQVLSNELLFYNQKILQPGDPDYNKYRDTPSQEDEKIPAQDQNTNKNKQPADQKSEEKDQEIWEVLVEEFHEYCDEILELLYDQLEGSGENAGKFEVESGTDVIQFLAKFHPELIKDFHTVLGDMYKIDKDETSKLLEEFQQELVEGSQD